MAKQAPALPAERRRYQVQPVVKALRVLDAVAEQDGQRLSGLALALRLPKTTVFRYLCSLEAAGYLEADRAAETWRVGDRFRALGDPAEAAVQRLRAAALPIMAELRDAFDETVNLGVLRGGKIVYVEIVESSQRLRLQARVGGEDPAHSTALGRAILAHLPEAERDAVLAKDLPGRTARTARTRQALEAALAATLAAGYAVERGENEEGAVCVGAAILDGGGRPVAALSLSAPEQRMGERRIADAGAALGRAARRAGGHHASTRGSMKT